MPRPVIVPLVFWAQMDHCSVELEPVSRFATLHEEPALNRYPAAVFVIGTGVGELN